MLRNNHRLGDRAQRFTGWKAVHEGVLRRDEVENTGPGDRSGKKVECSSLEETVEEVEKKWVTVESTWLDWKSVKKQPENTGGSYPDTSHIWVIVCIVFSR